jgi:hypothetical protein
MIKNKTTAMILSHVSIVYEQVYEKIGKMENEIYIVIAVRFLEKISEIHTYNKKYC